jgi:hypothetical protein
MAWYGKITEFKQGSSGWDLSVLYYNDISPDITFLRQLSLPFTATKAEAIAAIQARGQEVKRVATLSEEKIIGQTVPIP